MHQRLRCVNWVESPHKTKVNILTPKTPCHLCRYGVKGTKVDESCFNDPVKWDQSPCLWTALLVRDSAVEIHGFREYCKYGHVRQAIAKANPWNKQTKQKSLNKFLLIKSDCHLRKRKKAHYECYHNAKSTNFLVTVLYNTANVNGKWNSLRT